MMAAALPHALGQASAPAPSAAVSDVPKGMLWGAADLINPYPTFAHLAQAAPLHWSPTLFGGTWVVTRYADAEHVLRDDTHFSAQRTGGWVLGDATGATTTTPDPAPRDELAPMQQLLARALLFVDAPDHARLRSLMHAGFTPSGLAAQRLWITQRCESLLDAMQAQQTAQPQQPVDFMAHLARPLPAAVIAHTLGLPEGDEDQVMAWSGDIAGFIGSPWPSRGTTRTAQRGLLRMSAYLQSLLRTPAQLAPHGLLARLLQGQAQGQVHNATELLAQAAMLLFAGHETTRYLLGNMVLTLLSQPATDSAYSPHSITTQQVHPTAWQQLLAQPQAWAQTIPQAVREVLRFEPPVQYTGRRVATTHRWHGQTLQRGQGVLVLLAAANRDPARFDAPACFDITRRGRASLAFGTGAHVCIGAALSMMEAETTLAAMLRRWPDLRLGTTPAQGLSAPHQPDWLGSPLYRGLHTLPLWLPSAGPVTSTPGNPLPNLRHSSPLGNPAPGPVGP